MSGLKRRAEVPHIERGHIRFGDPEVRLPVDTDEQIAAAKRALADAGIYYAPIFDGDIHRGYSVWADEATWRGWTIGRGFIERNGERRAVDGILGDIRCAIDRIEEQLSLAREKRHVLEAVASGKCFVAMSHSLMDLGDAGLLVLDHKGPSMPACPWSLTDAGRAALRQMQEASDASQG